MITARDVDFKSDGKEIVITRVNDEKDRDYLIKNI